MKMITHLAYCVYYRHGIDLDDAKQDIQCPPFTYMRTYLVVIRRDALRITHLWRIRYVKQRIYRTITIYLI